MKSYSVKQLIDIMRATVGFVCFVQEQCAVIYFVYIEDINITAEVCFSVSAGEDIEHSRSSSAGGSAKHSGSS